MAAILLRRAWLPPDCAAVASASLESSIKREGHTVGDGQHLKPQDHCVVVLGASPKPTRYAFQAVKLLRDQGYRVIPVHPKAARIDHIPAVHSLAAVGEPVHTLTLYVGAERTRRIIDEIVGLRPGRVIFNPGTESRDLERALKDARIPFEQACTLVLLRTRQF
jgi:predicted CoA-binding protein